MPQPFVQHNKLSERIEFQTYRANMIRVLQKLDNNYSADWKNKALHTAIQAYHLQKELLPPRMPPVQVSAIRPTGFRQATWEVQSKQSGRIVISSDTDPRRIAEAIGHGVFEKLVQEGFIRRYKAKDFAEFFGYFLFHEALTSKRLLQNNYFYECTEGNKNVFIRKLHNKRFR